MRHGRYVIFQMAEVAVPKELFQAILRLIAELRPQPPPAPAWDARWSCVQQLPMGGVRPNAKENGQISPPDNRSGCPMPLVAPSRRGCLAARPVIREHSRQIGSHLGNPG